MFFFLWILKETQTIIIIDLIYFQKMQIRTPYKQFISGKLCSLYSPYG